MPGQLDHFYLAHQSGRETGQGRTTRGLFVRPVVRYCSSRRANTPAQTCMREGPQPASESEPVRLATLSSARPTARLHHGRRAPALSPLSRPQSSANSKSIEHYCAATTLRDDKNECLEQSRVLRKNEGALHRISVTIATSSSGVHAIGIPCRVTASQAPFCVSGAFPTVVRPDPAAAALRLARLPRLVDQPPLSFLRGQVVRYSTCAALMGHIYSKHARRRPLHKCTEPCQLRNHLVTHTEHRLRKINAEHEPARTRDDPLDHVGGVHFDDVPKRQVIREEWDAADLIPRRPHLLRPQLLGRDGS